MAQSLPATGMMPELVIPTTPAGLLDLHTSLTLSLWPALALAVSLYAPHSPQQPATGAEIRDWLAGSISSMIQDGQIRDQDDLEEVLLQVMGDEFECVVEDGSEMEVSRTIWKAVEKLKSGGDTGRQAIGDEITNLWKVWIERGGANAKVDARALGKKVEVAEDAQDTSDEGEDDDEEDEDEDDEMGEAPQLVNANARPKEKVQPEIDEEGFTKVVRGKKR